MPFLGYKNFSSYWYHLISNLGYSDDTAILGIDGDILQKYFEDFQRNASVIGLKINVAKTKSMAIDKKGRRINIKLGNDVIEQKEVFEYLGFKLSTKGDQEEAVNHRISKGWAAFGKYRRLLTSKSINIKTKTKVYQTYILTAVMYGMECVTWTEGLLKRMEIFQNKILRAMTNKRLIDKVPCLLICHLR